MKGDFGVSLHNEPSLSVLHIHKVAVFKHR